MTNGWDVFNALFATAGADRIIFNENDYKTSVARPANGIPGVVAPGEDDFLSDEPGCKRGGLGLLSAPVNCASIGGMKGL
jgi:hypothetical protein